jgi:EmrB/QacA subfamily drug resistance transporter
MTLIEPRTARPGWTLALTSVAFFMVTLDSLVVITALPAIGQDFRAGISTLEWTINAYALTMAAGIVPAAALGDRYGRRRVFAIGLAVFTLGSAACALSADPAALITARAVQGTGAAIVLPLSLTLLTAAFPGSKRGAIIGIWGGIAGIAVASGPLVGGAVVQGLDWHWIFWVNVPIGLGALLNLRRLRESRGPVTSLDLPAVTLVTAGATSLIWALVRANEVGWRSVQTLGGLGLGAVLLAGFVAWERRVSAPMLPLRLFRGVRFSAANATSFLLSGALLASVFLTAQYFQLVLGYSPLGTGLHLLPWTATPLVVAPLAGTLSDRLGARPVLVTGMSLQGLGLAWFGYLAQTHLDYASVVAPFVIAGIGASMVLPTAPAAALGAVAPADMGKASGANNTLQRFGGAFGIAVATAVFSANGHLGTPASFVAGYRPALALAAGLSVLGAVAGLAVGRKRRAPVPVPVEVPVPAAA